MNYLFHTKNLNVKPGKIISIKHDQPMSQTKNVLYKNKKIYHKNLKKYPDKSDTNQAE
ncbi:hypothetical protein HMPREF1214_00323 [Bacteroides sp. HPS0048]|nr:hypothetical protein HMPREF1214_00323 [Bacteroides sp. HPS0048]